MKKLLFIALIFFIVGCNANESLIDPLKPEFQTISFDVVQKELIIDEELPDNLKTLISQWFDEKVKINGFDGSMTFKISNYLQEISLIDNGKRVDLKLSFNLVLKKSLLSQKKIVNGNVSSYGTLTGNFSLKDFETVITNTQTNLVQRLSKDLNSKI